MTDALAEPTEDIVSALLTTSCDPLKFVRLAFPTIRLERWQHDVLTSIGKQLHENRQLGPSKAIQCAISSGNGIGKSALLSWLMLWSICTFEECLGVTTAGTEGQLRTRLWGELSKWFTKLPEPLRGQFQLTATALFHREQERTWRIDARPWTERSQEAWSGLHNYGKRVLVIMDECSVVPESIWRATEAMLSDAETQIVWVVAGNPIRLDGRFPMCFPGGRFSGMWTTFKVDSREVSLTNKEMIAEKISYYGENSNYVKSHVKGEFPTASQTQLIPLDLVEAAAVRDTYVHPADPIILGVDVASGHGEDSSVVYIRQGLDGRSHLPQKFPNVNPLELAYKVVAIAEELGAQATFIDAGGLGEGCVAKCRELGLAVHAVYFAGKPDNPSGIARAANKRAEVWLAMMHWLKAGAIPNDPQLIAELTAPEYTEAPLGILLERKSDMRARGLASPDCADAFSLTFSSPVFSALDAGLRGPGDHMVTSEYSPFSEEALLGRPLREARRRYTAPGWSGLKEEFGGDVDVFRDPQGLWGPEPD
jgi:hypothetical protein